MNCIHVKKLDYIHQEYYCIKCFQIFSNELVIMEDKFDKNPNGFIPIWKRDHDRGRFTKYMLEYLNGFHNEDLGTLTWWYICKEVPSSFTWYDVHKVYRSMKLHDYWLGFGHFINGEVKLNKKIVDIADSFTHSKINLYRVNYMYLIYKFTQLYSENEHDARWIPLKGKLKWITKMDAWWFKICEMYHFKFIPTKIYVLKWNKEYIVKCLEKS